jgi:hypothetical protein
MGDIMTKKQRLYQLIEVHGNNLLKIFPDAKIQEPIALCKKLFSLENKAHKLSENYCNGLIQTHKWESISEKMEGKVNTLLGSDRVFHNGDARGWALKIELKGGEKLYQDMGGFGIIAPDFREGL